jgi:hypothetical protein
MEWGSVTDWIQVVVLGYGALKVAEWAEARRATHRSDIATEALVSALTVLDILQSLNRPESFRFMSQQTAPDAFRQTIEKLREMFGYFPAIQDFNKKLRTASAILTPDEVGPLIQVLNTARRALYAADQYPAELESGETEHTSVWFPEFAGPAFQKVLDQVRADLLAGLQPIARVPDPPGPLDRLQAWISRSSHENGIDTLRRTEVQIAAWPPPPKVRVEVDGRANEPKEAEARRSSMAAKRNRR